MYLNIAILAKLQNCNRSSPHHHSSRIAILQNCNLAKPIATTAAARRWTSEATGSLPVYCFERYIAIAIYYTGIIYYILLLCI